MTRDEAVAWVADDKNADEYIRGFESVREGQRQYEFLLDLVESGHVKPEELHEYGFPMPIEPSPISVGERVLMVVCTSCKRKLPSPDEICCWCGTVTETWIKGSNEL